MHVAILQHVPFEGAGSIESWLQARGARQRLIPLHAGASLPEPETFDLLIVLGGPMSVNDEADDPWLQAEKQLLARVIDAGKPVLGICL
ncbi:MAG: glutamine amidotransferase-related protein, partial [Aeromonadaceae bacterium]